MTNMANFPGMEHVSKKAGTSTRPMEHFRYQDVDERWHPVAAQWMTFESGGAITFWTEDALVLAVPNHRWCLMDQNTDNM